jgi:hypothetical protein
MCANNTKHAYLEIRVEIKVARRTGSNRGIGNEEE